MKATRLALLALLAALAFMPGGPAQAQEAPDAGWTSRAAQVPVRYKIDAELVETGFGDGIRIVGDETVLWKNPSNEPVKVIYLHTYANAFRSTRSTFLREAMRDGLELPDDMKFGDLAFSRISTHDEELTPKWVSPDDGNPDDRTVVRLDLASPVEAGGTLLLKIGFTLEMPRVLRRMGARNGFVMAAQWYPKLGMFVGRDSPLKNVHDGWYCHQYHANCEFAADFADYDVTLKFPREFKVGATGVPQGADTIDEKTGLALRRYKAESVVDFAWTADKRFVEHEFEISPVDPDSLDDPASAEWRLRKAQRSETGAEAALPKVTVVLLMQPEHLDQMERTLEAARVALGFFGTWLGPYPYGRLTVVDPPWGGASAGGMEYPMLVTAGTVTGSLRNSLRPEGVTVHEICHQWLMGVLASNEAEEAWLDEGINSYLTAQAMDAAYGPAIQTTDVLGLHFPYAPMYDFPGISAGWPAALDLPAWARPPKIEVLRLWRDLPWLSYVPATRYARDPILPFRRSWLRRAGVDEMVKSGWTYADRTSYGVNAYARPALFMNTLRRSLVADLGADKADRVFFHALREYARENRFRHPTTEDFLRKWKELAADPGPAADVLVRTAATFDYAVDRIASGDDPELQGFDDKGVLHKAEARRDDAGAKSPGKKSSVVRITRRGDGVVPVDFEVTREDGTSERRRWEVNDQAGQRWRDFRFEGDVISAEVDPGSVYLQDLDRSNNSYTKASNRRPAVKWSVRFLGWIENALTSYGRFF